MELHENHEQGGGQEFESSEEASAEMAEERVQEQIEDPSVLANPTELREGGVSGGDSSNTQGGDTSAADGGPSTTDGGASDDAL